MTDNFDFELRDRLAAVSAAVPVDTDGALGRAVSPRVQAGSTSRRFALGSLVPVVALVVTGVVIAGVAGLRPVVLNGSRDGPVVATVTDGAFELTIRSTKARYVGSEPIQIDAALTYRGASAAIEIFHAQGAHGGPLGFGIEEPVMGDLRLATGWDMSCERSTLEAGTPLSAAFQKGGSWSSDHPQTDEYRAYVADPVLRLAEGTWHVFAVAEFSLGDCGGEAHHLRADIEIDVVGAEPSSAPAEPTGDGPVTATASDGQFELTIRSSKLRYAPDEPIEIEASLTYAGDAASIQIFHGLGASDGPLAFGVTEPVPVPGVGGIRLGPFVRLACRSSRLDQGVALQVPFAKSGGPEVEGSGAPSLEAVQAYFADRVLRLPGGTWHPYVVAGLSLGDCGGEAHNLRAELGIVVSDDPGATPDRAIAPSPTPVDAGALPIGDDQQEGPWQLVLTSPHRRYSAGEPIEIVAELGYWGEAESVDTFGSSAGRIGFGIRQVGGNLEMSPELPADCSPQGPVPAGERQIVVPFEKSGGYSADDPNVDFWESYFRDPELRLPAGTWEIWARTAFALSDCRAPGPELRASITITVVP